VMAEGRWGCGQAGRPTLRFELHLLRCGLQEGTVSTVVGKIEAMQCCPSRPLCHLRHNTVSCGDPGVDAGVIGKIEDGSDGELASSARTSVSMIEVGSGSIAVSICSVHIHTGTTTKSGRTTVVQTGMVD
jgi:hypothetical protein